MGMPQGRLHPSKDRPSSTCGFFALAGIAGPLGCCPKTPNRAEIEPVQRGEVNAVQARVSAVDDVY